MDFLKVIEKLNNLDCDKIAQFYYAKTVDNIAKLVSNVAPCAKLAVFTMQNSAKKCVEITDAMKKFQLKPITVVLEDGDLSTESVAGLFNIAEDVRGVVVTDYQLFDLASYFATVRNIPLVNLVYEFYPKRLLSNRVYIKNFGKLDAFGISVKRHVVFVEKKALSEFELSNAYAYVVSKMVSLIDYRIRCILEHQEIDKKAYLIAREAIVSALVLTLNDKIASEKLLIYCMMLEVADNMTEGKLLTLSAPSIAQYLTSGSFCADSGIELLAQCVLLELYDKCFSIDFSKATLSPDYLDRAEVLSRLTCFNEKEILKGLQRQVSTFNCKGKKISGLKQLLKEEIANTAKLSLKIMNRYFELGGKSDYDTADIAMAVKLSGDTPLSINGMSLVRESAITE